MKQSLREKLSSWDEGSFDLTDEIAGPMHKPRPAAKPEDHSWIPKKEKNNFTEMRLLRRMYPFMAVALGIVMIVFFIAVVMKMPAYGSADTPANSSPVIERYISQGLSETGATNIVAGVILDYRAFDTLGESHVLFTATMVVFILLLQERETKESEDDRRIMSEDLVLRRTAVILVPFIFLFGIYVLFNGHLGPGGGFAGGSILGSGFILSDLAFGTNRVHRVMNTKIFNRTVVCALLFYSLSKCYSFFCGANGLETIFKNGTPGAIFSAGLIMPLDLAVGIVVTCVMYGYYAIFTRGKI